MEKEKAIGVLNSVIDYLGITVNQLSESIGKNRSQWAYDVLNPEKKVGISKNIAKLISQKYPQISKSWLLTGEGSMLVDDVNKEAPVVTNEKTESSVPYYGDLPVSAGEQDLATVLDNMEPTGWINLPGMLSSIGAFPVVGCSMEPDIKPGDFISIAEIDRWERLDPDKTYMIITHNDRMIKHLSVDEDNDEILWCISPNYPKFRIDKSEIVAIYRVTFHGRLV